MNDTKEVIDRLVKLIKKSDVEFFLFEAPYNNYTPKPLLCDHKNADYLTT